MNKLSRTGKLKIPSHFFVRYNIAIWTGSLRFNSSTSFSLVFFYFVGLLLFCIFKLRRCLTLKLKQHKQKITLKISSDLTQTEVLIKKSASFRNLFCVARNFEHCFLFWSFWRRYETSKSVVSLQCIYIYFFSGIQCLINRIHLGFSWRRSLSYGNQCLDLLCKSLDWFLYDRDHRHERVITKQKFLQCR